MDINNIDEANVKMFLQKLKEYENANKKERKELYKILLDLSSKVSKLYKVDKNILNLAIEVNPKVILNVKRSEVCDKMLKKAIEMNPLIANEFSKVTEEIEKVIIEKLEKYPLFVFNKNLILKVNKIDWFENVNYKNIKPFINKDINKSPKWLTDEMLIVIIDKSPDIVDYIKQVMPDRLTKKVLSEALSKNIEVVKKLQEGLIDKVEKGEYMKAHSRLYNKNSRKIS